MDKFVMHGLINLPSFSIVVNTLNRAEALRQTLESFRWLKYAGKFEVVVVNGPSTDHSDEVIKSWLPHIRAGKCDVANLSVSRNIGICMARGDIVAFIDDDAIPEPEWLTQLAAAYEQPEVGAAGGLVFNHTGYEFQYTYCLINRLGEPYQKRGSAAPHLSFPKSYSFPHLLGCNSSFRRSVLLEIGGFDEEYEYFLDETDVCTRVVDAGYMIAQLSCAYVHHKYASSNIRGENRVVRYRYPVLKNKVYFMLKHAREFFSFERILREQQLFIQSQRNDVQWALSENLLSPAEAEAFEADVERAIEVGLRRGLEGVAPDGLIHERKQQLYAGDFLSFQPISNDQASTIVLLSQDYPPDHGGGIATFSKDLALGLAAEGHIVHVLTQSHDIDRVDFESGVWVHRLVVREIPLTAAAMAYKVPAHIWNWSATAHAEAERISTHRSIDVVEAPIWDCEGIAFLLERQWPLVVSLQTTLHFWMESHPKQCGDLNWMASFARPMLAMERRLMLDADGIRSISAAIAGEIEAAYAFKFDRSRLCILPLGLASNPTPVSASANESLVVLFVGRLERRKGIDALLDAIPVVLRLFRSARFRILGDNSLSDGDGQTYQKRFLDGEAGKHCSDHLSFEGRVDEKTLREAYAACDVFVAPSRFESFGLVFLEAMREGKPVIGCRAGGMPEVITDEITGLLVPPGDSEALAQAIVRLLRSPELRAAMGAQGRLKFEQLFTAERMARASVALHQSAARNWKLSEDAAELDDAFSLTDVRVSASEAAQASESS